MNGSDVKKLTNRLPIKFYASMSLRQSNLEYSALKKYFDGKSSKEEDELMKKWLSGFDEEYRHENFLHLLWNGFKPEEKNEDVDLSPLLDKIHHTIHLRNGNITKTKRLAPHSKPKIEFNLLLKNLGRVAAIFLLPVMVYLSWEMYSQKAWIENQADIVYYEIRSPQGAQSQFELPDGTTGNLNNGSRLKYPSKFTGKNREIELYGEAYLDVKHSKSHPFIVHTAGLDVKVLGTSLNIYSYPDEEYQEVSLKSGSIELIREEEDREVVIAKMKPGQHAVYNFGDTKNSTIKKNTEKELVVLKDKEQLQKIAPKLKSNQQAMVNIHGGELYMEYADIDRYTGWTEGKLILRNEPLDIMLKRIGRWYGVKFNINAQNINKYTYWATFEEENIEEVLKLLSLTGPLKFEILPRQKVKDGSYKIQEIDVSIK